MSEEENKAAADKAPENAGQKPKFVLRGLYVKDISFENPGAPAVFFEQPEQPKLNIAVDVKVQKLPSDAFEVALVINVDAKRGDDKNSFMVELSQAGIFLLDPELSEDEKKFVLLKDCAETLFPYARRVVSDLTRDGGFPPLLLEPIDFEVLAKREVGK